MRIRELRAEARNALKGNLMKIAVPLTLILIFNYYHEDYGDRRDYNLILFVHSSNVIDERTFFACGFVCAVVLDGACAVRQLKPHIFH